LRNNLTFRLIEGGHFFPLRSPLRLRSISQIRLQNSWQLSRKISYNINKHTKHVCRAFIQRRTLILFLFSFLLACSAKSIGAQVAEPGDYRMENYDAPVPETLAGAKRVDALQVKNLREEKNAVIIDVIPQHRRPEFIPKDQIWLPVDHKGVAGAIWLPDTGYGVLSPNGNDYLKNNLEKHTGADFQRPIVFYCRLDCWMSWNAAKRSLEYGYTNVYWFADGIDGWTFEDFETDVLIPEPGERQ